MEEVQDLLHVMKVGQQPVPHGQQVPQAQPVPQAQQVPFVQGGGPQGQRGPPVLAGGNVSRGAENFRRTLQVIQKQMKKAKQ